MAERVGFNLGERREGPLGAGLRDSPGHEGRPGHLLDRTAPKRGPRDAAVQKAPGLHYLFAVWLGHGGESRGDHSAHQWQPLLPQEPPSEAAPLMTPGLVDEKRT